MVPTVEWRVAATSGNTAKAVEQFRALTGAGLAAATTAVERWRDHNHSPPPDWSAYRRICERVSESLKRYADGRSGPLHYAVHILSPPETVPTTSDPVSTVVPRVGNSRLDVAVEVVTADCRRPMFRAAILEHLAAGARMVWVIDAEDVSIRVAVASSRWDVYYDDFVFSGGDVLPGFTCKVADLFA